MVAGEIPPESAYKHVKEPGPAAGTGPDRMMPARPLAPRAAPARRLAAALVACVFAAVGLVAAPDAPAQGITGTVKPAVGAAAPPAQAAPAHAGQVVAADPALSGDMAATSFRLNLNALIQPRAFVLANPDRLIVEMPEVQFRLPPRAGATGRGLIAGWRGGLYAPGRSRMVFDLAAPAEVARLVVAPDPATGVARMEIDLAPVPRDRFAAAAARSRARAEPPPAAEAETRVTTKGDREPAPASGAATSASPPASLPVVVIDPGHGGVDFGTWSRFSDMQEKDLVLAVGHLLRDRLAATGRYKVVMTRSTDVFIALDERVRLARAARADLFISLHADAEESPGAHGATIYTLSESASDQRAADLAAKENRADTLAGLDVPETIDEVGDILIDLARRESMQLSHVVARGLVDELKKGDRAIRANPHRAAGFRVLKAHDFPSVLIELGFMTNREDVERMTSAEWRRAITDTLARSIDGYFARRLATAQPAPARAAVR